jgi:tRNA-2-methylthio-N6-dimethylallyladenosine synthase
MRWTRTGKGISIMASFFIETFGCQMNVADSDLVADLLLRRGCRRTDDRAAADLLIVNTCSVREHAEQRAKARLRELVAIKRKAGGAQQLWVIGCMAERLKEKLKHEIPGIDQVIGAMEIEYMDRHIDRLLSHEERPTAMLKPDARGRVSVFVPIMRGCDNFCAYCVVPHVRGREHSIPPDRIAAEIRSHLENGAREVTLLGQNVNSYGADGCNFPDLLRRLHGLDGLLRIRFMTSHPKDCSEKLVRAMAELPRVCRHIHLPVQSGSTRVLTAMNRRYTRDDYLRLIDRIRSAVPECDITTDVMVGFPGETDEEYRETMDLFRTVRFTSAFMFAYSPRPGTKAAEVAETVRPSDKKQRLSDLIALQTAITREHYAAMVGREADILISGRQRTGRRLWLGQDHGAKNAIIACSDEISGTILKARVKSTTGMTLVCERMAA